MCLCSLQNILEDEVRRILLGVGLEAENSIDIAMDMWD